MPRIRVYYGDENSDPKDFCKSCFPSEATATKKYKDISYDEEHPPYDETDYRCEICKKNLKEVDE
jgi:hypothetical protein